MLLHVSWHTPPISTLTEIRPHSNPFLVLSVPSPVQNRINTGRYPTFHKIFSLPYSEPPGAFIGLPFFPFAGSKATRSGRRPPLDILSTTTSNMALCAPMLAIFARRVLFLFVCTPATSVPQLSPMRLEAYLFDVPLSSFLFRIIHHHHSAHSPQTLRKQKTKPLNHSSVTQTAVPARWKAGASGGRGKHDVGGLAASRINSC